MAKLGYRQVLEHQNEDRVSRRSISREFALARPSMVYSPLHRDTFLRRRSRMAKKAQLPKSQPGKPPAKTSSNNSRWLLLVLVGAVGVLVLGVILLQSRSTQATVPLTARVGEGTSWGPADAPVQITDYSDFG
jgi:hypothetical protein